MVSFVKKQGGSHVGVVCSAPTSFYQTRETSADWFEVNNEEE